MSISIKFEIYSSERLINKLDRRQCNGQATANVKLIGAFRLCFVWVQSKGKTASDESVRQCVDSESVTQHKLDACMQAAIF